MLTYGMLSSLYLGQFSGVLVGGLALLWWGLAHGRWNVAGIGLILAASKYHTGALPALILILCSDTSWGQRLRVLPIPAAVCLSSFAFYGFWPLNVLATYQNNPPNAWGNISPWHWIGPFALLIWIPPFIVRMDWRERIIALFATTPLGVPYFQHTDLVMLGVMPIGWLSLLGNLGFLKQLLGMEEQPYLMTLPLVVYLATLVPHAVNLQRRSKTASPEK